MSAKPADLPGMIFHMISESIDEEGYYPSHGVLRWGEKLDMMCFDIPPQNILKMIPALVASQPSEMLLSWDCFTRPGQGTEFADVAVGAYFAAGEWRMGVVNYQHEPRVVRPWDWRNAFWMQSLHRMLQDVGVEAIVIPGAPALEALRAAKA